MKLQLINGQFGPQEALSILTRLVDVKVKYHTSQIDLSATEEDVKTRERRIRDLQRELDEVRRYIDKYGPEGISIQADISISVPEKVAA